MIKIKPLVRNALFLDVRLPIPQKLFGAALYRLSDRWQIGSEAVVAIGTFDGVHRGHQYLIHGARDRARALGLPLVVVTFDPDPALVLEGEQSGSVLLSSEDRLRGLASLSPDALIAFCFTPAFAALSAPAFFDEALLPLVTPREVHVGEGFSLGKGRRGSTEALRDVLAQRHATLWVHELLTWKGKTISATRIRALLNEGRVDEATQLLGRSPHLFGQVIHGRGEGTSFGFPTANVAISTIYAFARQGVFSALAHVGDWAWPCAVNLGEPPSFRAGELSAKRFLAEASLVGYSGNLYGSSLNLVFVEHLRDSQVFESLSVLKATVSANLHSVAERLGTQGVEVA